ncbi:MAG: L-threonylcarbamoyladenylate synthase [Methanobacterium sp.]|nr:L-threonylcarbamoyladenylate synthase [Methanobacterium sp.]
MKIIKINKDILKSDKIEVARTVMKEGSIIVYPTDTVYGIGANIFDEEAILKVFSAKKRSKNKPLSICVSKIQDINNIAYMDLKTSKIADKILPGPYTLILKKKNNVSSFLSADSDKIGVRIPDNEICRELSRDFPITSTSANISGQNIPESVEEVVKQLGSTVEIILDAGICKHGIPSTVIDMTIYPPEIIRKGAGYELFLETMAFK